MIIPMNLGSSSYNIYLERGISKNAAKYFNLNRRVLVVTDDGVPIEYAKAVAANAKTPYLVVIPNGEKSKSLKQFEFLLSKLTEFGFTRSDCVVAVGGGVVGDLSGFAAASYMRGIDFYNIPTTVLSQVDSSIGGKVAIDFGGYKNIVGAFYQPKAVIVDPETLNTLDKRQISNGLSESVKMAMTSDSELFRIFEQQDIAANIDTIIERSLKIKKSVVEQDEKEAGIRKILNFGHTVGHAVESESNLSKLYHGECVAIGMLAMCHGETRERLLKVLKKLHLPTNFSFDTQKIADDIKHDKKMLGNNITVVYVEEIGSAKMQTMSYEELTNRLKEVL